VTRVQHFFLQEKSRLETDRKFQQVATPVSEAAASQAARRVHLIIKQRRAQTARTGAYIISKRVGLQALNGSIGWSKSERTVLPALCTAAGSKYTCK